MPEISVLLIVLMLGAVCLGAWLGWLWRGRRATLEKSVVNAQWQDQLESQGQEQRQLVEQNKLLMEQNSHYRASTRDASERASELSDALKEALERRDRLQRQIEDVRAELETAVNERSQQQGDQNEPAAPADDSALRERDVRIATLTRELENWQSRLPPLVERYRVRDAEAGHLEAKLAESALRIKSLESELAATQVPAEFDDRDAAGVPGTRQSGVTPPETSQGGAKTATGSAQGDAPRGVRDDLKLIKGVGPAIEKTLNEMGVFRFDQVAAMTELEIDRIAHRLKGFRSRIYREDWIGQARDLQLQTAADG